LKTPTMYQLWWNILYDKIWDEYDTASIKTDKPNRYVTIHLLFNKPDFKFFDILKTAEIETANELYQLSFSQATDSLKSMESSDYSWYNYKNTSIQHILSLDPFSKDHIKIGGGKGIVNAASETAGPSWRMVVEMKPEGTKAWGVYPGSQTGNPGNPNYGHMIDKWSKGEYYELVFGQDISKSKKIIRKQTYKP
jgi:penicillin amidase